MSEQTRERVRVALRKRRERLREEGRCVDCGLPKVEDHHVLCRDCRLDRSNREAERRAQKAQQS